MSGLGTESTADHMTISGRFGRLEVTRYYTDLLTWDRGFREVWQRVLVNTVLEFSDDVESWRACAITTAWGAQGVESHRRIRTLEHLLNQRKDPIPEDVLHTMLYGAPPAKKPDLLRLTKDFLHDHSQP